MTTSAGAVRAKRPGRPKATAIADVSAAEPRQPSARSAPIRRAILDAAIELFAERGYAGTNLQDVADIMGMSRTGLYYHFPSKESLLHALVEEISAAPQQVASSVEAMAQDNPAEALREMMRHNIRWILNHGRFFRVLDKSENDLPDDLLAQHNRYKRATLDQVVGLIDRGIHIGQFRPVDSRIMAFAMLGMTNWTAWWFKPEGRIGIETVVAELSDAMLRLVLRSDSHRTRTDQVQDALRIMTEDLAHLKLLIND